MKAMRLAVSALLLPLALCAPAHAQSAQCAGLADVLEGLDRNYGEGIVWQGSAGPEVQIMVTAKPDGSTWSLLMVQDKVACLMGSGTGWSGLGHPAGEAI